MVTLPARATAPARQNFFPRKVTSGLPTKVAPVCSKQRNKDTRRNLKGCAFSTGVNTNNCPRWNMTLWTPPSFPANPWHPRPGPQWHTEPPFPSAKKKKTSSICGNIWANVAFLTVFPCNLVVHRNHAPEPKPQQWVQTNLMDRLTGIISHGHGEVQELHTEGMLP